MKEGKLLLITGPSGVGKRTLLSKILNDKDINLTVSVSLTTRDKRPGEQDGVDYIFVSKEEFRRRIENGEMLEYAEFFNNYYGTSKEWVESRLKQGINVLLEIETKGFHQIQRQFPNLVSIFILPVSIKELEKRLRNRGTEGDEAIAMRLEKAEKEIQEAHLFTYRVVNDDLDKATEELREIIRHALE